MQSSVFLDVVPAGPSPTPPLLITRLPSLTHRPALPCLLAGTDLQGDEREVALRAATVEAGARLCAAASERSSGAVEPWQLSAYLLRQEEQAQRARQEGGGGAAEAEAGPRRHVARGTTAY